MQKCVGKRVVCLQARRPGGCHRFGRRAGAPALQRSAHKSVQALEADIRDWITQWNDNPRPFVWKKTAEEILDFLARYLQRTKGGEH